MSSNCVRPRISFFKRSALKRVVVSYEEGARLGPHRSHALMRALRTKSKNRPFRPRGQGKGHPSFNNKARATRSEILFLALMRGHHRYPGGRSLFPLIAGDGPLVRAVSIHYKKLRI